MKSWLIIAALLLLLVAGGYYAIMKTSLPKLAEAFIPVKWQSIPLGEKRSVVHQYLGSPGTVRPASDEWIHEINHMKRYVLSVQYNADTMAVIYKIDYQVDLFGLLQETPLRADTFYHQP